MDKTIVLAISLVVICAAVYPVAGLLPQKAGVVDQSKPIEKGISDGRGLKDVWPMFRYNEGNTGCSPYTAPNTNHLAWKHQIGGDVSQSTPILYADKLYIGTNLYVGQPPKTTNIFDLPPSSPSEILRGLLEHQNDAASGLYCLDSKTGEQLWFHPMNIVTDPAVVDDKIYVTDFDDSSYYSSLICLDATTGELIWSRTIDSLSLSPMIVANEKIYVGCLDLYSYAGTVKCYDLSGNLLWNYHLSGNEALWFSAPAISGGNLFFIATDMYSYYTGNLYCLNAASGQFIWSHPVFSFGMYFFESPSPVCTDSKVYVTDFNFYSYEGYLRCYDGATGNLVWSCYLGAALSFASPAVSEDSVFLTAADLYSYNSWLYKMNSQNGTYLWRVPIPVSSYLGFGSPVCSADKVIVSPGMNYGYSDELFCFDKEDGSQTWQYTLDSYTVAGPSIGDGRLYITDSNGNLYAFEDVLKIPFVLGGFLGVNALMKNTGNATLTNITWTITVTGGYAGFVNRTKSGTIQELETGKSKLIRLIPLFGLGAIVITVKVTLPDTSMIKKVKQGVLLGSITVVRP